MIQFTRRIFCSIFGKSYGSRLREIAKSLNIELTDNLTSDEEIEAQFVEKMAERKYAGSLDWRFRKEEFVDLLTKISTEAEKDELNSIDPASENQGMAFLEQVNRQFNRAPGSRQAVVLESLGDFYHVLLVPPEVVDRIRKIAGGWLKG